MTQQRADETERMVFYRYIERIMRELEECENSHVVFNIGRHLGMMQRDFQNELLTELDSLNK